jgi:Uma2 family endonuclease
VVAQPSRQFVSVDEWRALERNSHDAKHEYIDGQIYLMSGGSRAHSLIAVNMVTLLNSAFGDGPCIAYNSDVAARLSPTRYTYPDTTVTCDECDQATPDETEIQAPRVIVEVLSDTTEAYDRTKKFALYRACPTIQEYVLVATRYQAVEVYRRTPKGWTEYHIYGPGEDIELTTIGVTLSVAAIYRRTTVLEMFSVPEGEV